MNNEQILKKAIEKAMKNGWDYKNNWHLVPCASYGDECIRIDVITKDGEYGCAIKADDFTKGYYPLLFSHDFVKACCGEEPMNIGIQMGTDTGEIISLERWQYHLQQMVLEKEPLKYIEKYL